jgi:putative DNA primase/helicase
MRNSPGYDEVTAIMNAGHKRGSYVWRCDGDLHEPKKFFVFGAQLIAMIGKPKDTTASRSIVVELERATAAESRSLSDISDIDPLRDWEPLRAEALRWANDHISDLQEPAQIPDGVHGRHRDNWRPLLRVAEVIGDDSLLAIARDKCTGTASGDTAAHGFTDRLMMAISDELSNYRQQHPSEDHIHTQELFDRLQEQGELIPEDWKPARLSRFLTRYKCSAGQCRTFAGSKRGYPVDRLNSIASRYTSTEVKQRNNPSKHAGFSPNESETGEAL